MIELTPTDADDLGFLAHAQRIINGAITSLEIHDVFLVHVDTWFDHKWLGWRSGQKLCVPTFTPHRVRSEKRLVWNGNRSTWAAVELKKPLHRLQPGRSWRAQPLDRFAQDAAFIWYSGGTATNTMGCLMLYRSGADGNAWYASIQKNDDWRIVEQCRISREELLEFENRGRRLEVAPGAQ
jgi:hypothetical protein